ncbi:hypothetical protein [Sphingobium yanoikuyae]|uniref:hypothetical protein n=1 Tax=Sphingobium yanoikuyae TaxID=13690 RepID=UPI001377E910|nr:hypothetical protein [Sphingobium yanoikuyae]NBB37667.1 hypothetical protein [Sphingobium yanoikuyae]
MSPLAEFRGPWVYDDVTGHVSTQPDEGRPHGAVVAHAGHHPGFIRQEVIGPLAAAAPELLVALEELIPANLCASNLALSDDAVLPVDMTLGEIRRAIAAITKAKGGAA